MARHDVAVILGCSVTMEAHGQGWVLDWATYQDMGGEVERLRCPQCGRRVGGNVTLGVCLGEHHGV